MQYESQPEATTSTPLVTGQITRYSGSQTRVVDSRDDRFNRVPTEKRQLGLFSIISLIFNRMIGTGIYATPSLILRASGSVGLFMTMWVLGAVIASVGMAVFVEFGTGLPRSGAEKNYLEYLYRKPRLLVTCCYAMFALILAWSAANAVVFGEYMVHAFGGHITQWNTRLIGMACITAVTFIHTIHLNLGLRIQNILAVLKICIMLFIIVGGFLAVTDLIHVRDNPRNFDNIWHGTTRDPSAFVAGLYNVVWSFNGFSNAHYALSEAKDPVKTIKRAAPIAMILVIVLYFLVNLSYLAVVPKEHFLSGGRVIAALFFGNLFGDVAEKILSIVICMSTFGNLLVVFFSQSRVIQELGREGILPYSAALSSNYPFDTPFTALAVAWVVHIVWIMIPPPGDAYNFVANVNILPISWINLAISAGLFWIYIYPSKHTEWRPPYRAGIIPVTVFLVSNIFLFALPFLPPNREFKLYDNLPYWSHVAGTIAVFACGVIYWYVSTKVMPRLGGYRLVREVIVQDDGMSRAVLKKVR